MGLNLDDPGSPRGRGSVFTDNLMAHASAAVEKQQIVSSDKITSDLQVSFQGRPFGQKSKVTCTGGRMFLPNV